MTVALVIASHPDDEVLGCGATMARWSEEGTAVHIVIMGEGITSRQDARDPDAVEEELAHLHEDVQAAARVVGAASAEVLSFPDNRFDTVARLDLTKAVEAHKAVIAPDIVLTHHGGDLNIDHRRTFQAVLTAHRPIPSEKPVELVTFEVPSSTEWQAPSVGRGFEPTIYVRVEQRHVEAKIAAMEAYRSERREFPHPRSPEALRSLARWRGANCGFPFAEALSGIRRVW